MFSHFSSTRAFIVRLFVLIYHLNCSLLVGFLGLQVLAKAKNNIGNSSYLATNANLPLEISAVGVVIEEATCQTT